MGDKKDDLPELQPAALIASALTLTAALAWNEAAKTGIAAVVPGETGTFGATLAYAVAVTILVIVVLNIVRAVHNNFESIKSAFRDGPPAPAREDLITRRVWMQHCH